MDPKKKISDIKTLGEGVTEFIFISQTFFY